MFGGKHRAMMDKSGAKPAYKVSRLQAGPWLVLDGTRLVASCPEEKEARAIAAFMNGDMKRAVEHLGSKVNNARWT